MKKKKYGMSCGCQRVPFLFTLHLICLFNRYVCMYIFMYVYMYVFETGSHYIALADYVVLPIPPEC